MLDQYKIQDQNVRKEETKESSTKHLRILNWQNFCELHSHFVCSFFYEEKNKEKNIDVNEDDDVTLLTANTTSFWRVRK